MTINTHQPLLPYVLSITPLLPALLNFYVWIHSVIQTYMIDMENLYPSFTNRMFLLPPCRYVGPYSVIQTYMIDMENLLNLLDKRPKVTEKPGAKALKVTKGERSGRHGNLGG